MENGILAEAYGKRGEVVDGVPVLSPPLAFENPPKGTACFALIMEDPDSVPVVGFVCDHWLAANITGAGLEENASVDAAAEMVQGLNCFGTAGYGGPSPPNAPHTYLFTLYALSAPLDLADGFTRRQLEDAMDGRVLGTAMLSADYSNSLLPPTGRVCGEENGPVKL